MDYRFLSLEADEGLGVLTMNRPPGNALSFDFIEELEGMIREISADRETRCLLIRSAIPKYFMVGADLKTMPPDLDLSELDPSRPPGEIMRFVFSKLAGHISEMLRKIQACMNSIESMPWPTIAAIGGHALGGGCELALACDFRIMARGNPRIGLTETGLGLIPAAGGTQRLPRTVGYAKAVDLIFNARRLDADEAQAMGLVNMAVEPDELEQQSLELGKRLAEGATLSYSYAKKAMLAGENEGLEAGLAVEREAVEALLESEDMAEGVMAFNQGVKPEFKGR